jgi:ABC-2 type transport system permease protein
MKKTYQIIKAEVIKQHRNWFHSHVIYFSLLIWPIITLMNAYYSYKPFDLSQKVLRGFNSEQSIILFLITGFLGYVCFWSLVQSAWQMGSERQNGTLEIIFLTSASRITIMYGRALGALFENIWMFFIFCVFNMIYIKEISLTNLIYLPLSFIILMISAVVWGGLMNVIFLFSRDASILFNIFDEPMVLFSGVRIPTTVFPLWAKAIAVLFPLTHSLSIIRSLLMKGYIESFVSIYKWLCSLFIMVVFTIWMLKKAEKHARQTGNLTFY